MASASLSPPPPPSTSVGKLNSATFWLNHFQLRQSHINQCQYKLISKLTFTLRDVATHPPNLLIMVFNILTPATQLRDLSKMKYCDTVLAQYGKHTMPHTIHKVTITESADTRQSSLSNHVSTDRKICTYSDRNAHNSNNTQFTHAGMHHI